MVLFLYNISIQLYELLVFIFSLFNSKARLFRQGRKNWKNNVQVALKEEKRTRVWFHFASLGEFEQGRPVLEHFKTLHPNTAIVMTFFSPSGYEVRKNYLLADYIFYLPLDTKKNADYWVSTVDPKQVFFTKYEYWYHYFSAVKRAGISLYMISAIYRETQPFFKWYGGFHRQMLQAVTWFFIQDEKSGELLKSIGFSNYSVSGDTRFDRVYQNSLQPVSNSWVEQFLNGSPVVVVGSSWQDDEKMLASCYSEFRQKNYKLIIAPHEIGEAHIQFIQRLFGKQTITYTALKNGQALQGETILLIDCIGILASLYRYADWCYVGGGFNKSGIHNTLEPAAYGKPVVFGPNYKKFKEAADLIQLGAAFSVHNKSDMEQIIQKLTEPQIQTCGYAAKQYVIDNINAVEKIFTQLENTVL